MASIYNKLSKKELEAKLKETSKTAPEYSDIQAAIEKKQEEIKSDLAKELDMTSWGKPSEEFNELFDKVKSEKDGGASLKELMHPGYGIFKNKDPDTIRSIYNIAKLPGKNTIDTSGILKTHQAGMINWEDIKNLGTKAGEGIIRALQYVDPFSSVGATENKESFILPEKKYRTSNVYDEIGQHSERRIQEKPFSKNYDKATYLGTNNIDSYLNIDEVDYDGINNFDPYLNIDTLHWDETDRQNAIHSNAFNLMKQNYEGPSWLERHNAAQREYNRVAPGANVTSWGEGHGNPSAAVQGRRNEAWMNSLIGNYTMGIGGTQDVKQNLINKYGTVQQKQNFADAIARKTHSPDANYGYWESKGVDRADITADVTGMYTDDSSGIGDIGNVTTTESSPASTDIEGIWVARGGMVKDAPRYRYAEGGIVNLLPKGAW